PPGYFTMLVVQLLPLMITGFVLADDFIIGTRVGTLMVVLIVYGMISSRDGTFNTWWHCLWATLWLSVAIIGTMFWVESVMVRKFVHDYEKWIAYGSIAGMVLYVVKGQREVAKELFRHFVKGNYTLRRFRLQLARFLAFALQTFHYFLVPSKADPFLGLDPIFVNGALGTLGVVFVIVGSVVGWVKGKTARRDLPRAPEAARAAR